MPTVNRSISNVKIGAAVINVPHPAGRQHNVPEVAAPSMQERQESVENAFPPCSKNVVKLVPRNPVRFSHIGIVGGMGPAAGNQFCDLLVTEALKRLSKEQRVDQAAPQYTLVSRSPEIDDRTKYLLKHNVPELSSGKKEEVLTRSASDNPLPGILRSIEQLRQCGAQLYVVTCNTAHAWSDYFPKKEMKHVHIVEAALNDALTKPAVKTKLDSGKKVRIGLLATTGTIQCRIYQEYLKKMSEQNSRFKDVEFITPSEDIQQGLVMKGIYDPENGIKGNNLEQGGKLLRKAAQHLIDQGADALSLSCTEIPLVVKQEDFPDIPIIDASAALAKEAIDVSMRIMQGKEKNADRETESRKLVSRL